MKRLLILVLINLLLIGVTGCQSHKEKYQNVTTTSTTVTTPKEVLYEIQSVTEVSNDEKKTIEYPQLVGQDKDYTMINSLIHNEVDAWIHDTIGADAMVDLKYSVTFSDNTYICVLFEGDVAAPSAAHPTNVVHSVCVSLIDEISIDPLESFDINDDFIEQFKKQLIISRDTDRFTDDQWDEVVTYIDDFSNAEIKQMIKNGETALVEDGVLICIEVPRAIGDYVKICVDNANL